MLLRNRVCAIAGDPVNNAVVKGSPIDIQFVAAQGDFIPNHVESLLPIVGFEEYSYGTFPKITKYIFVAFQIDCKADNYVYINRLAIATTPKAAITIPDNLLIQDSLSLSLRRKKLVPPDKRIHQDADPRKTPTTINAAEA